MPTLTIEDSTDAERIQLERAISFVLEMQHLGATVPHGTDLDTVERFALDAGRPLLVQTLEAAIRARAEVEKKSPGHETKGTQSRTVTTVLGPIRISRCSTWNAALGGCHPADEALGLDGVLSPQARRLLALAGVEHSFDRAHSMLREFCGWTLKHQTYETQAHGHGLADERSSFVAKVPPDFAASADWLWTQAIGTAVRITMHPDGTQTDEVRYSMLSRCLNGKRFAEAVRGHWGIESVHWVLDVPFREDDRRMRERTLANTLSWLRRFAVTLLRRHPIKDSIRGKMIRCLMNAQFLDEVLTLKS